MEAKRAFTLSELLVVIAIIAILAALLFSVFSRVRERSRQVVCLSNIRQINTAVLIYTEDYDKNTPNAWLSHLAHSGRLNDGEFEDVPKGWRWMDVVKPYHKNEQVFVCPKTHENEYKFGIGGRRNINGQDQCWFGSYGINHMYSMGLAPVNGYGVYGAVGPLYESPFGMWASVELSMVEDDRTVLLADAFSDSCKNTHELEGEIFSFCQQNCNREDTTTPSLILFWPRRPGIPGRHFYGANISMIHGGAKWYRLETLNRSRYYGRGLLEQVHFMFTVQKDDQGD